MKKIIKILLFIFLFNSIAKSNPNTIDPNLEPGKETRLNSPAGDILVFVPTDYNESCNWPVIFFYHGQGGTISTDLMQKITDRKGFVIVSVEFAQMPAEPMTQFQYKTYVEKEMKNLGAVRHLLQSKLKIDPKMTILAGVSKGGWLVSNMIDYRPQIAAAALMCCAGVKNDLLDTPFMLNNKFIFIGAGETDQNLGAAKRAVSYFRGRGADVLFQCWGGFGHDVNANSEVMKEWLAQVRTKLMADAKKAADMKEKKKAATQSPKTQK